MRIWSHCDFAQAEGKRCVIFDTELRMKYPLRPTIQLSEKVSCIKHC